MNIRTIITAIVLCVVCVAHAQTQVFVSSSGNDNSNGQTWETAKQTIAAGIAAAGDNGTVYVKAGSYSIGTQLNIPVGVSVKGGYRLTLAGTDTAGRDLPGTNSRWENPAVCTILTGGGSNRIAVVNGLLEGCVMRRGVTTGQGGGVLIDGGTVRYCVICECDAIQESNRTAEGGGAYIRNNGVLTNCVITECRGDNGPAVSGGPGSLVNNTITRNWPTHCGKVVDYDGNVYNTVIIGQQCWTHENLRTTHYNDGTAIPLGNNQPTSNTLPYYYINYSALTATNLVNYGYLYNWSAVMHGAPSSNENPSGVTGICPLGWHVPSDAEWTELTNFVNAITRYRCNGYDGQIAKALMSKSGWSSDNTTCNVGNNQGGNNITGFAAYPAGYRTDSYNAFSTNACFWSTRESSSTGAWNRYSNSNDNSLIRNTGTKSNAYSVRCVKQLANDPGAIMTSQVSNIQSTQAICGGICYSYGDSTVIRGICWSTSPNPTIDDSHTTGIGEGSFVDTMTGLSNGVTYYVRAYLINSIGVKYGAERVFTADNCGDPLNLTDYDGNTYNSVRIGTQCWMKENLRTTHFADGTAIPSNSSTSSSEPYWYYPNNNASISETYGLFYNWPAVMHGAASSNANPSGVQGICPNGWHVPSRSEWQQLVSYVQGNSSYWCDGNNTYIAKALASQTGWNNNSGTCYVGNNPSQQNGTLFSALPAGYRTSSCGGFGSQAEFFTSTEDGSSAYRFVIQNRTVENASYSKYYGYSIRCVRDE